MNLSIQRKARTLAMLCHLSAIIWLPMFLIIGWFFNVPVYIPFISIVLTFLIWKRYKNRYYWVDVNGKESLNFQISITIYIMIYTLIILLLSPTCGIELNKIPADNTVARWKFNYYLGMVCMPIGIILFYQTVSSVAAAIQAYRGKTYRYSSTIRFLQ